MGVSGSGTWAEALHEMPAALIGRSAENGSGNLGCACRGFGTCLQLISGGSQFRALRSVPMIVKAIAETLKRQSKDHCKGRHLGISATYSHFAHEICWEATTSGSIVQTSQRATSMLAQIGIASAANEPCEEPMIRVGAGVMDQLHRRLSSSANERIASWMRSTPRCR
jgi:hypothetical protein